MILIIYSKLGLGRDQPNSRFHGRDIFREIGLLPWKNAYFREIHDFLWILTLLLSFMKVSEFYQQHFVRILLFAWAEQWRLTVLSLDSIYICSKYSFFRNVKCTIWQIS